MSATAAWRDASVALAFARGVTGGELLAQRGALDVPSPGDKESSMLPTCGGTLGDDERKERAMSEEAVTTLNNLIHLDMDAIRAYRQAIDACQVTEVRDHLSAFMFDHQRHIEQLDVAVRTLGGQPPQDRDLKGFFIEGFTAIMSQGDHSALLAMRGNEELTMRSYDAARKANITGDVRLIVERNHQDEVRHLEWIKSALDRKLWEALDKAA